MLSSSTYPLPLTAGPGLLPPGTLTLPSPDTGCAYANSHFQGSKGLKMEQNGIRVLLSLGGAGVVTQGLAESSVALGMEGWHSKIMAHL